MNEKYHGIVKEGTKRAGTLGYPTINIMLSDHTVDGIYVAKVSIEGKEYKAAAFGDPSRNILEAHLLDFSGQLLGKEVAVELIKKIRDAQMFQNDEALRAAIAGDLQRVRKYFDAS